MMERVVVTGAQGFVGRHLVHLLLGSPGVEVLGIGRSPDDRAWFTHEVHHGPTAVRAPLPPAIRARLSGQAASPGGVPPTALPAGPAIGGRSPPVGSPGERYRYRRLDLRHTAALVRVLGEFAPTCVVHLAAALRDQPLAELLDSNVGAAASMLDALVGAKLESCRVVLGSTGGVYGQVSNDQLPLREELRGAPVDLYSLTKQTSEDATRILAERHGLRVVWARLFNLVGPGQEERHFFGRVASQLAAIRAGQAPAVLELGDLAATRDFVDVRDAADALWLLAQHGEPGLAYNVASGDETRIADALALLLDVAALDVPVEVRSLTRRAHDVPRHVGDITRICALGFRSRVALRDSARDVVAYYTALAASEPAAPPPAPGPIAVAVAARCDYTIEVAPGLVERLHLRLAADYPGRTIALVTDARVWQLYGRAVVARGAAAGLAIAPLVVPEGERSKSPERCLELVDELHRLRVDRRGLIVNLGGGLVTDLGGFVAATYLRGLDYVNVPTTLLAQHDAAIGGKVAVNAAWGTKNFLGAFHHPRAVLCDPSVLATLAPRDLAAGVAEAIKVALCGEPALFALLETGADRVRAADPDVLARLVRLAAAHKAALLAPDPYEVDLRRVLNLGHTIGHALEVEVGHHELRHGEAVAFGIAAATAVGVARGICARVDADRIFALLARYDLPPPISRAHATGALRRLDDIRLARGNRLNFVIPIGVHAVHIEPEVGDDELARAVDHVLAWRGIA